MRSRMVSLVFAGLIGTTVSLAGAGRPAEAQSNAEVIAPVAVQRVSLPAPGLRDEAAMVLVGTALIGLAAAVRRAA